MSVIRRSTPRSTAHRNSLIPARAGRTLYQRGRHPKLAAPPPKRPSPPPSLFNEVRIMWPFHHFDARGIRSQQPYWLLRNGIGDASLDLRKSMECDVLIVGAGITGALIANELTDENRQVIVIDHRDVALGSTSASTALLQYEIDRDLTELIELVGLERAQIAYRAGIESIDLL